MATITSAWTENLSVTFDDTTPTKDVEGVGPIDLAASGYIAVMIQFEIAFGSSADGNATIRVRSSSNSGTDKDTIVLYEQEISFTASTTKRISVQIEGVPYIEIGVLNGNAATQDITISATYAGLKYSSA